MKTLTGQPAGWYLYTNGKGGRCTGFWDGRYLSGSVNQRLWKSFHSFERLYTESEVAELRTELAAAECLIGESVRGAEQVNAELEMLRHRNEFLEKYRKAMFEKYGYGALDSDDAAVQKEMP